MKTRTFNGVVKNVKFIPDNLKEMNLFIASREGRRTSVTVGDVKKPGSGKQRRYYWGVIIAILSDWNGDTDQDWHNRLTCRFLRFIDDQGFDRIKRYSTLTTAERETYHEQCRRFGSIECGVFIPDPNQA